MDVFVTGTDTDAGKTLVASTLLHLARQQGFQTLGLKPIAAGCDWQGGELVNADALSLKAQTSLDVSYFQVNPVTLEPPIAPHIAASEAGVSLNTQALLQHCQAQLSLPHDFGLVEGAGGWLVPLNEKETLADFAVQLKLPVVLVVGMKLGCISHALLTVQCIQQMGCQLIGWVANQVDPAMARLEENLNTLKDRIDADFLGLVPYLPEANAETASSYIRLPK